MIRGISGQAAGMTPAQGLQQRLAQADTDGNGSINLQELEEDLQTFGKDPARAQQILDHLDLNHDGEIDQEEQQKAPAARNVPGGMEGMKPGQRLQQRLAQADTDGNGSVNLQELQEDLEALGIDPARAQDLLDRLDLDKNGAIDQSEQEAAAAAFPGRQFAQKAPTDDAQQTARKALLEQLRDTSGAQLDVLA
jgi:Ca2+-binding EF-hand superfamily protein